MKATNARILNRDFQGLLPKDNWFQIEVSGEHEAGEWPDGRPRKQVIDDAALTSILNRFRQEKAEAGANFAGILVDKDHLSHDLENDTEAMAWLQDLRIKDGKLEGKLDPSDIGEAAILNRRYKFFSTEYDPEDLEDLGDGRVRPLRLAGLAFTNRPRKTGGRPILNRTGDTQPGGNPKATNHTTMKSIAEKLGLPADADEAAILAKVASIMAENTTLKGKEAETAADTIMNRFGDRVPEAVRTDWRQQLIANRATTEPLMEKTFPAQPDKKPAERIHNRATTTAPAAVGAEGDGPSAEEKKKAAGIRNRAASIAKERNIPFSQAFNLAKAEA